MMKVKNILAHMKIRQSARQMESESLVFPDSLRHPKHVLVCLPGGLRELTLVKQFLPTITELFKPADIALLCVPGIKVNDIFPRKGFQILSPSSDQLTWVGLPKRSYIDTLRELNIDLVLDLNLEQSNFTSSILLNFPGAVRIGRGNHLGRPFYNLEIKTKYLRDERNIYRSLLDTIKIIKESRGKQSAHG
ncbi:MAG: hypothetical protein JSU74_02175 [Candidatus Zixiibacteriota bacterium]|nr:MAG: hypothetical protein JSU74_02175 [candidate division Zixibacteria bacterium]